VFDFDLSELPGLGGAQATVRDGLRAAARPLLPEPPPALPIGTTETLPYAMDPIGFARDVLLVPEYTLRWSLNPGYAAHKWDGTRDPLVALLEGLAASRDVGVEAGTGTQKTFTAAIAVLWFLASFSNSTVVTEAPKEKQLTLHLWKEISRLWPRFQLAFPGAELSQLRIRMRPNDDAWAAHGFGVGVSAGEESATKAQGFHAEHMLIITEETPGMNPAVMTANENTCTGPHNLRLYLGNPDSQHDELHKACESPGVLAIRISALDHPNVVSGNPSIVPGAASREKIETRRAKYGEEGRLYLSRVRGLSPAEASDALIKLAWCRAAAVRLFDEAPRLMGLGPPAMGVDVANSEDGDKAAIARGQGAALVQVRDFQCADANQLAVDVKAEAQGLFIQSAHVGVDSVGVGAGTINKSREISFSMTPLSGGSAAVPQSGHQEKFDNLRSQMYWQMRLDLEQGIIGLPDDEELFADLTTPRWKPHDGKIIIESKKDIRKRLGRSPNKGDAAVYWNWVRQRGSLWLPPTDSAGKLELSEAATVAGRRF
jgi:phage terminase large subunit